MKQKKIAIIGGGPSGLSAAEVLSASGHAISVYDAMPTFARKFLLAGKSGLNITHSEDYERFATRFSDASPLLRAALDAFTPADIRVWAAGLGTETFVGSSGRVFPNIMKASPLLRAWLARLEGRGVSFFPRHRWIGFTDDGHAFETPDGGKTISCDATLFALGGASYPRLGSDAAWVPLLVERGITIAPFQPANCGFDVAWSDLFQDHFAGQPLKSVTATSRAGTFPGEFVITRHGIEGSLIYTHSAVLRDDLREHGQAALSIDLAPGRTLERLSRDLARQGAKSSFSNRLRKGAGIDGAKAALLRELAPETNRNDPQELATAIKALPVPLLRPRPIAEAISSAGGIAFGEIDETYMLKHLPGVFAAGEMLDWEAPTGGYLLTACFATGRAAAKGIEAWLGRR
ncbi:hypothetical protein FHT78_004388 [Rhizobium sp. BK196]|uniref:TIGR03862 family flavoprotein n=1 Tax=Rhizobium sp. BK196 TaxID=2587073 RepID=UPI00160E4DB4|nr:TIGR03862 family flavoprotein [Rhizobium sp. BK196]MBB3312605.1 hypothetical protein [Rhizobium sp. BK196]